ncbi:hypothetical protein Lal_00037566 [Lupinus albus]|nr:hypothetical protein Lal_00037566 [Lupinus albus]
MAMEEMVTGRWWRTTATAKVDSSLQAARQTGRFNQPGYTGLTRLDHFFHGLKRLERLSGFLDVWDRLHKWVTVGPVGPAGPGKNIITLHLKRAKNSREVIFSVMRDACIDGDLSIPEAVEAVHDMFARNAMHFYKLSSSNNELLIKPSFYSSNSSNNDIFGFTAKSIHLRVFTAYNYFK